MSSYIHNILGGFLRPDRGSISSLGPAVINTSHGNVLRKQINIDGLPASLFKPAQSQTTIATIIYCHSYNSNRAQCLSLVKYLSQYNISLLSFDFQRTEAGELNSKGIISFGMHQPKQLQSAVRWCIQNIPGKIILWGRSMGAFIALRYQTTFGNTNGLVLDSPYLSLVDLIVKTLKNNIHFPEFILRQAIRIWKKQLNDLAGFEIDLLTVDPSLSRVPAVFICSRQDNISGEATEKLYEAYKARKFLFYTQKSHDEQRDEETVRQCLKEVKKMARQAKNPNRQSQLRRIGSQRLIGSPSVHKLARKSHIMIQNSLRLKTTHSPDNVRTLKARK